MKIPQNFTRQPKIQTMMSQLKNVRRLILFICFNLTFYFNFFLKNNDRNYILIFLFILLLIYFKFLIKSTINNVVIIVSRKLSF